MRMMTSKQPKGDVQKHEKFVNLTKQEAKELKKRVGKISAPPMVPEEDHEDELESTRRGQIVKERRHFLQEFEQFREEQKWGAKHFFLGLMLFFTGAYSLIVPFYKILCERWGFSTKTEHQDYRPDDPENQMMHRKWRIHFQARVDPDLPWRFEPQQRAVQINAGETCLVFYRAYNDSDKPLVGLSIYQVEPNDSVLYFNKIQCFCFENQLLQPKEHVDLPVFFYLDPAINHEPALGEVEDINLSYQFFLAHDQTIAEVVQKELEKHEENQIELKKRKDKLRERGIEVKEIDNSGFSALPSMSPYRKSQRLIRQLKAQQKIIDMKEDSDNKEEEEDQIETNEQAEKSYI